MASMDNRHRIVGYGVAFADQLAALEAQLGDSFAVDMVPPDLDLPAWVSGLPMRSPSSR